ncbi:MAG: PD-(D/E)XK nuclease family protein, partial [Aurantimonas coralicida]
AEVPVAGEITLAGRSYRVNGTIDRLAVTATRVLIVDYKTNRPPPASLAEVSPAYIMQLALYREMLKPLYPDRPIEAALLFTEAPRLIALSEAVMEQAVARRRASTQSATERQENGAIA